MEAAVDYAEDNKVAVGLLGLAVRTHFHGGYSTLADHSDCYI